MATFGEDFFSFLACLKDNLKKDITSNNLFNSLKILQLKLTYNQWYTIIVYTMHHKELKDEDNTFF